MNAETRKRAKQIFAEALSQPAHERDVYLDRACNGDRGLREHVVSLLAALVRADDFLAAPTVDRPMAPSAEANPCTVPGDRSALPDGGAGTAIGPYKLLEGIGEGGFGTVYMAEQEQPVRRRVAIKIIKRGMDTRQVIARFEAERQALAMMEHPNIARVLDAAATENGRPYFVMELVRGVPITTFCDENKLPTGERLTLFADVCHAVQHAHTKGIIHRDLKPTNVLVSRDDDKPVVKIIDFGIAKATGPKLTDKTLFTEFRQLIGTPAYMSPEQAGLSDIDIDTRSDIYSLGVLLYELLTGTTPFDSKSLLASGFDEMRRMIREVEPQKPSTRVSSLSQLRPAGPGKSEPRPSGSGVVLDAAPDGSCPASLRRSVASSQMTDIVAARLTDPKSLARLLRGDLDWIVMKCLEKDRQRRYETASGLAIDVRRYLKCEPVQAGPPGAAYRVRKFVQRHRMGVLASSALAATLLLGVIGTMLGWHQAAASARVAQREAANASAINMFLQETMAAANPVDEFLEAVPGAARPRPVARDRRLIDVLNQATESLDAGRFKDELREALLRRTIGRVYRNLGHTSRAEAKLRLAYQIQQRILGRENPDTLTTLVALISAVRSAPDRDVLLAAALETVPRALGGEDRVTLSLMQAQADALVDHFQEEEAVVRLRELLSIEQRILPPGDPQTLHTMDALVFALQCLNQYSEGRRLARELVELAARVRGEDDVTTHMARIRLARVIGRGGLTEADLSMIQTAAEGLRRHLGDEHECTFNARRALVGAFIGLRKYDEAEKAARTLLADEIRLQGDAAVGTWRARGLVWEILNASGRREEADVLARDSQQLFSAVTFRGEPDGPLLFMKTLFEGYKLDRRAQALAVARQALALLDAHPNRTDAGGALNAWRDDMIYILTALGQLPEAERVARQQIDYLRQTRGPTHRDTLRALNGLAWALFEAGRFPEAEPLAREAVDSFRKAAHPDALDQINTIDTLAMTLCKLQRPAEAEPLFSEIFEIFAHGSPPGFSRGDTGLHALHYGECLLMLKRYPEAESRLLEAVRAAGAVHSEQTKATLQAAHERLVEVYEGWGRLQQAAACRQKADGQP